MPRKAAKADDVGTSLVLPGTAVKDELAAECLTVKEIIVAADALEIANKADVEFAGNTALDVRAMWSALEERRTRITAPMNAALREVNAIFRPTLNALENAETKLKAKIGLYTLKANEAAIAAQAEVAAGNLSVAYLAPVENVKGVSVKPSLSYALEDLSMVPLEYLMLDHTKVIRALKGQDADFKIPGLSIEVVPTVRLGQRGPS